MPNCSFGREISLGLFDCFHPFLPQASLDKVPGPILGLSFDPAPKVRLKEFSTID